VHEYYTATMEMQQMMELLRKELRSEREAAEKRADDRWKAWREKMAAMLEELVAETEATRAETRAIQARMEAMRRRMDAKYKEKFAETKPERDSKTLACQEMEARLEEEQPTSLDRKPEAAEQREVPVEDAEIMLDGEPKKKMRRDRNQRKKKKRTQGNDGCRRRLVVARRGTSSRVEVARQKKTCRKMSRRATVTWRKRNMFRKSCGPRK
jgi:hypothetical protein